MGKMKEIAQIPITWNPHVRLEDLLDKNEYREFLSIFKYDKENTLLNKTLCWEVGEYNSITICNKINYTLLAMDFNPKDIVYLDV